MIRLLLVEDDSNLSYIVEKGLHDIIGGYEVVVAENGKDGIEAWKKCSPDIIVSDIDMPVMDGYDMVKRIRETDGDIPILFASALTSPKDVRKGYDIGVNNYVKKPYIPDEMDAHIRAVMKLKMGQKSGDDEELCNFGHYTLNTKRCTLLNNETEQKQPLTARETGILQVLAENKGEVVRREAVLSRFWNTENDYFASRSLDVFIAKLRKLFADDTEIEIVTKRGAGFILKVNK